MNLIGYFGTKKKAFQNVLNVTVDQELGAAADSLEAKILNDGSLFEPSMMELLSDNGELLFKGIVDDIVYINDQNESVIKLHLRSLAALLLDNEAPTLTYREPAPDLIAERHAKPFGIEYDLGKKVSKSGTLTLAAGNSHYSVIKKFCADFLGTTPRISGRGVLYFDSEFESEPIRFDNKHGIHYDISRIYKSRYSRISCVYLVDEKGGITSINDKQAQNDGIVRQRYLYAASGVKHSIDGADKLIENGRKRTYCVELVCTDCLLDCVGFNAEFEGRLFRIDKVKYTLQGNLEKSVVRMYRDYQEGGLY